MEFRWIRKMPRVVQHRRVQVGYSKFRCLTVESFKKKLFSVQDFFRYTETEGRHFFEELDRDGDGQVTLEDLEIAMRNRNLPRRLNIFSLIFLEHTGWNMKVCAIMAVGQLLVWAVWGGMSRHPSRLKLWTIVLRGALSMLLEIYDFPPCHGYVDAHALWHAATIPLTYLWWSFIKSDAEFRTATLVKMSK